MTALQKSTLLASILLLASQLSFSQANVRGKVYDANGPLPFSSILLVDGPIAGTTTDLDGEFFIPYLYEGTYTLSAQYIGYKPNIITIDVKDEDIFLDIELQEDLLELNQVIATGTFNPLSKLESSVAITTFNSEMIKRTNPQGTGELMASVPGVYVDRSSGNINNRIFVRGLTSGTTNLLGQATGSGFRYISLQEDGLPVISTMSNSAAPDYFHRVDRTVARLEAIRGGSSSVTSANSPGGIFNFISKTGDVDFGGEVQTTYGMYANSRYTARTDVGFGGPIGKKFRYYTGGFYRLDEGARDISYPANVGGQAKANLAYIGSKTVMKLHLKYLNDNSIIYGNIPVTSVSDPTQYKSFDPHHSSLSPKFKDPLPNFSQYPEINNIDFDPTDKTAVQAYVGGFELEQSLNNNFLLSFKSKVSDIHQTVRRVSEISEDFDIFNIPNMEAYNPSTNTSYTADELAGGAITLATVEFDIKMLDIINQVSLTYESNDHRFVVGGYGALNQADIYSSYNVFQSLLEPEGRILGLRLPNPYIGWTTADGQPITGPEYYQVTENSSGLLSVNTALLPTSRYNTRTLAAFVNDEWKASDKITIDAGVRMEWLNHSGSKNGLGSGINHGYTPVYDPANPVANPAYDPSQPASAENPPVYPNNVLVNGLDGNPFNYFDILSLYENDSLFEFDIDYGYVSASLGFNYRFDNNSAIFARGTRGIKAPDLDYYVYNFSNSDITPSAAGIQSFDELLEQVIQGEFGWKLSGRSLSVFSTFFYNNLQNVPYSTFGSASSGEAFFTPTTFNESSTYGIEMEVDYKPIDRLKLQLKGTYQIPRWNTFKYYDLDSLNNSIDNGAVFSPALFDEHMVTLNNRVIADLPHVFFDIGATYQFKFLTVYSNFNYIGERAFNVYAAEFAPGFFTIDAGAQATFGPFQITADVNNLTNTVAFTNYAGYLGASLYRESLTKNDVQELKNSGAPALGTPILPRLSRISLSYRF